MTPQELKASILQRAIQGRLVEQLPTETLSESIAANALDRNREDIPFEIPDTWCWCYLEDIATLHNGRAYKKSEMLKNGKYPLLRVGNLFTSDTWYYSDMELEPEKYCDNGDLLYAWSASFGPHIWNGGKVIYHYHIWKVELRHPQMRDYMYWALAAQTDAIKRRGHGLTMIHITKAGTEKMLIPVPPIAEQKRIIAKIEELLPYIDRYEKAWSRLEDLNKRFPVDMQKSILQMAIQGKLVEQRPEEGTAEELFQHIQAEQGQEEDKPKRRCKKASVAVATEQEPPFDIPETWKWVRLGQLGYTNIGLTYSPKDVSYDGVVVLRSSNIQNGRMDYDDIVRVSCSIPENKMCHIGDVLICARNGSKRLVGKAALIDKEGMSFGAFMAVFRSVCNPYILHVINSAYFRNTLLGDTGTTTINQITQDMLKNVLIPLPPLAEQKRIVAKLEEILPLCERLK